MIPSLYKKIRHIGTKTINPTSINSLIYTATDQKPTMSKVFQQLFDKQSCTYTYLLGDLQSKKAVIIDTVLENGPRDCELLKSYGFNQIFLVSTHIHADHVTGNAYLKQELGPIAQSVLSKYYEAARADIKLGEGDQLEAGSIKLNFLHTPGHTSGCLSIVDHGNERVFTGDTLLIRGCGRTDFQGGSSSQLYDSVHKKLFTLPGNYKVYPAHDYKERLNSTIIEEINDNPRLTHSKEQFIDIMANLNLAYPKLMDVAVPRNLNCGFAGEV